ncbi:hypothetical protein ACJMK2_002369 [Sinanodonta woodiana]|uniref:DUF7869 domain-containing protein n=2 Tax=Sinanodonta woodiana TaxID=1069815 RepID=A0ABD3XV30_SINWO
MPAGITGMDLYNLYQTVHKEERLEQSQFYQIMSSNFPHVSFSKSQKCTKCTDCSNFKQLIDKEKNLEKRKELMTIRYLHLQQQQNERESYYVRRAQAEMRPHHALSLIIDGMDQRKTDLPHYKAWNNPNGAGSKKLRTHIMGSIVHGRNKHFFVDYNQYPHNTNMSLTILLNILINEAKYHRLPPVLYIQLDNTNKNKYFLGFLGYLVKRQFVKEVWLSFLIVGHTHEDIDQAFSKISHKLNEESHKDQNSIALHLDTVWNISEWLGDSICQVHNVTFPHLYRIFSDQTGHVTVQFKEFSTDVTWRPAWDEPPLEIFKLDERSQQIIPKGLPSIVEPKMDEDDWLEVKRSMEKDFELAAVSELDEVEWREFLENPFKKSEEPVCPLHLLQTYQEVESYSTLSEKENNLIMNYKKRAQAKQVSFNDPEPFGMKN